MPWNEKYDQLIEDAQRRVDAFPDEERAFNEEIAQAHSTIKLLLDLAISGHVHDRLIDLDVYLAGLEAWVKWDKEHQRARNEEGLKRGLALQKRWRDAPPEPEEQPEGWLFGGAATHYMIEYAGKKDKGRR